MSAPTDLQNKFARAVEAEYQQQVVSYRADGLSLEDSHARALEDAKQRGREVLEELRRRGLFPFSGAEVEPEATDVS